MILILIACARDPPLNPHAGIYRGVRSLIFGLSFLLLPYFMHARSQGSGKTAHMPRLVRSIASCRSDKAISTRISVPSYKLFKIVDSCHCERVLNIM